MRNEKTVRDYMEYLEKQIEEETGLDNETIKEMEAEINCIKWILEVENE